METLEKGQAIQGTSYDKSGETNESGVPTFQLADYLEGLVDLPSKRTLAGRSGLAPRMLVRIFERQNDVTSLGVADKLLIAVDRDVTELVANNELVIVPFVGFLDAVAIAVYENLDDSDRLMVDWEDVEDRAQELVDIREMLFSDNPEARETALEIARF